MYDGVICKVSIVDYSVSAECGGGRVGGKGKGRRGRKEEKRKIKLGERKERRAREG
jgi:hypothetical protein